MKWQKLQRPDNRVYVGMGGSGKTTLALAHAGGFERILIFDPNSDDEIAAGGLAIEDKAELIGMLAEPGPCRLIWQGFARYGPDVAFDWACRAAWAAGGLCVVWDDCEIFMSAGHIPPPGFRLWNNGRNRGLRVFACTKRPAMIARSCTANMGRALVFACQEPNDLAYLQRLTGAEAAGQVPALAAYHYLDWSLAGWTVKKPVKT